MPPGFRATEPLAALGRLAAGSARTVLQFVLPPSCLVCRKPAAAEGLCAACWSGAGFIERPYCERLGTPFAYDSGQPLVSPSAFADPPAFDRARAAIRFGDVGREVVHLLKYGDRLDLAIPLAKWMLRAGSELLPEADALVPVPLHWTRLWQRRFNQSAELARRISALSAVPVADDALLRTRATAPQIGLARAERAKNVHGAFAVAAERRARIRGKRLVLVDDVLTTGATANACARILRRAGARAVDVLTLARVVEPA
jgi:ComF family protein